MSCIQCLINVRVIHYTDFCLHNDGNRYTMQQQHIGVQHLRKGGKKYKMYKDCKTTEWHKLITITNLLH